MATEWFFAIWPQGRERWCVEDFYATEAETISARDAWLAARLKGERGSYLVGSFDVGRVKLRKELRRLPHNRDAGFERGSEVFGRRVMKLADGEAFALMMMTLDKVH